MLGFEQQFGRRPTIEVVSPGRINLIGEHIDYLGGKVMPIAIGRHLKVWAGRTSERAVSLFPEGFGLQGPARIDLDQLEVRTLPEERWLNYIIGVLATYQSAGIDVPGFCASIHSDLPTGAGLSSSAALETAIALVVESFSGIEQDTIDRALLCQRAEHEFAGVPCGIMDQLAVGAAREGEALLLDCSDHSLSYIPIPEELAIVTSDTGVKHALGDGEYRKRRESCDEILRRLEIDSFRELTLRELESSADNLDETLLRRARHAVTEMERVGKFADALISSDFESLGQLMKASHYSLRYDYEVSCPELDFLVGEAYALSPEFGVVGSRMTGGGFGGSTVTLVHREAADSFLEAISKRWQEKFGRPLDCFITSAVEGAKTTPL